MKRIILLMIIMCLFFSSIQGQDLVDSLKTDTIELYQYSIVIKHPASFYKKEYMLENGGRSISYASRPPISFITIMESANSQMDFGVNCIITDKIELEYRNIEKGICPLKGYYRIDYYKGTRIKVSYQVVSECELLLFDYILDSISIKLDSLSSKINKGY